MKYLKKFQTDADYQAFKSSTNYIEPNVSAIEEGNSLFYNSIQTITNTFNLHFNFTMNSNYVSGTSYPFEFINGMTMGEWLASDMKPSDWDDRIDRNVNYCYFNGDYLAGITKKNGSTYDTLLRSEQIVNGYTYYVVGPYCCFIAGTKITMSDGTNKNIEDIVIGDKVISLNKENNEKYETIVTNLIIKSDTYNMAKVTLENGNSVTMNSYHPLLTVDGWKSLTNYNGYPTLTESDILITENGVSPVISIEKWISEEPITTYTLNVADENENPDIDINDNFFANGICAHNAACK